MRRITVRWGRPPLMHMLGVGWFSLLHLGVAGSPREQLTVVCFGPLTIQLG